MILALAEFLKLRLKANQLKLEKLEESLVNHIMSSIEGLFEVFEEERMVMIMSVKNLTKM
jgi:hypothetical protein